MSELELTFDRDILDEAQALKIPDLETATIYQYIPELKSDWELGTQSVTKEGKIYSRIFTQLDFSNKNKTTLNLINLGTYQEQYKGSFYYRLTNYFTEHTYSSMVNIYQDEKKDFERWQKQSTSIRRDIVFSHELIDTLVWTRNNGVANSEYNNSTEVVPLPATYTLPSINVGKALGATIEIDPPLHAIEILNYENKDAFKIIRDFTKPFLLQYPQLIITIRQVTDFLPVSIKINFYGKYLWQQFTPSFTLGETETLIHPVNADYNTKLKPPGLPNIKDNFWNNNFNSNQPNFIVRNNEPSWNAPSQEFNN